MLTSLLITLGLASELAALLSGDGLLHRFTSRAFLEVMAGLALLASAGGFLFLVRHLCWAVQRVVDSCAARERTEQHIYEIFREYMDNERLFNQQIWSASSALSPC